MLSSFILCAALAFGPGAGGEEIAREAYQRNLSVVKERLAVTLVLINAHGERTERRLAMEVLNSQSRIEFESPDNVRGTVLLTHASANRDDSQWLYLPASKQVRALDSTTKTGSFMGSEFSYEDLAPPVFGKLDYQRLSDDAVDKTPCYRVEQRSKVGTSGYGHRVVWFDKEHLVPLKVELYDLKRELLKVATYSGYARHGEAWRAELIRMENRQTRKVSELRVRSREVGVEFGPERFRSSTLGAAP